ncbi:uncharacterized protein EDB91DRAFT_1249873 [Suillus paluster]|uniref:uncharacterized protein n=1 Tax=Suillus paluster TaxID=48578 RepID=UPI001B86ED3D|nr:uncharacterized protein EDB91DRAFT_1249873 [Suillus paluster]KAG1736905.1 hypothetical protein EDB91DRAFT_1249873 [Suillus paluster]
MAMLRPRNTDHAADIRSRIHPHEHFALTSSSAVLDPSLHDNFVQDAKKLIDSVSPLQRPEGWKRFAKCAETSTEMFLPRWEVDFTAFIQSVTLCIIVTGFYNVDPGALSPVDVAFMTNTLNHHSDYASRQSPLYRGEIYSMRERVCRWVGSHRALQALETILPAYESMWRLVALTLAYASEDQDRHNAFLDFGENPTQKQFRTFKVKNTRPSVEAIINEVLRLHPPMRYIVRKSGHPWWKRLFCAPQEMADIGAAHRSCVYGEHPNTFSAMRFYPQHDHAAQMKPLAFGHGGLSCVAEDWAPMAAALIVATVIDRVDDVGFVLAGRTIDTRVDRDTRTGWDGWVIKKKGRGIVSPPYVSSG